MQIYNFGIFFIPKRYFCYFNDWGILKVLKGNLLYTFVGVDKGVKLMLETMGIVFEETKQGMYSHLLGCRKEAVKIFPHCVEAGDDYVQRVQGCSLPQSFFKSLKK